MDGLEEGVRSSVTGSSQPGLKAKCSRVLLGQPCYMGWKQWQ